MQMEKSILLTSWTNHSYAL